MSKLEIADRRRRLVEILQLLSTSSPTTLAALAEVHLTTSAACSCVEACDACAARGALAHLCLELAEIAGAASDVLHG
jgi:dihydroorotase